MNHIKKAYFSIDGDYRFYEGYHYGTNWNGWAIPYFTKEIADEIVKNVCDGITYTMSYDSDNDRYIAHIIENNKIIETDYFESEYIKLNDTNSIKCYKIGAGYWTWDAYSKDKILKDNNIKIISESIKEENISLDY